MGYLGQFFYICMLVPIIVLLHYCQVILINPPGFRYPKMTNLEMPIESQCNKLSDEMAYLRREFFSMKEELNNFQTWKEHVLPTLHDKFQLAFDKFYSDQIGIFDYASAYAGGYIVSTPNTVPYPSKYGLRIFGALDFTINSQAKAILQDSVFPGKCFAFYGNKGRIIIHLSRPILITHVSLEHLRIGDHMNSAPKKFNIWGLFENEEEFLGEFKYKMEDTIIQTFKTILKNQTFHSVELRILSNHGNKELTCIYRFRVHSEVNISSHFWP